MYRKHYNPPLVPSGVFMIFSLSGQPLLDDQNQWKSKCSVEFGNTLYGAFCVFFVRVCFLALCLFVCVVIYFVERRVPWTAVSFSSRRALQCTKLFLTAHKIYRMFEVVPKQTGCCWFGESIALVDTMRIGWFQGLDGVGAGWCKCCYTMRELSIWR